MKATKEEKVQFLSSYQVNHQKAKELMMELEELRETGMRMGPLYSDLPKGSPNLHRLEECAERLEEAVEAVTQQLERTLEARHQVSTCIEQLEEERLQRVLRVRYLLGQTWQQAAETLYQDERWLRRLHDKALEKLQLPGEVPQSGNAA